MYYNNSIKNNYNINNLLDKCKKEVKHNKYSDFKIHQTENLENLTPTPYPNYSQPNTDNFQNNFEQENSNFNQNGNNFPNMNMPNQNQNNNSFPNMNMPNQNQNNTPNMNMPNQNQNNFPNMNMPNQNQNNLPNMNMPNQNQNNLPNMNMPNQNQNNFPNMNMPNQNQNNLPNMNMPNQNQNNFPNMNMPNQNQNNLPNMNMPNQNQNNFPNMNMPNQNQNNFPNMNMTNQVQNCVSKRDLQHMIDLYTNINETLYPYVTQVLDEYEYVGSPMFSYSGMDRESLAQLVDRVIILARTYLDEIDEIYLDQSANISISNNWDRWRLLRSAIESLILTDIFTNRRPTYFNTYAPNIF